MKNKTEIKINTGTRPVLFDLTLYCYPCTQPLRIGMAKNSAGAEHLQPVLQCRAEQAPEQLCQRTGNQHRIKAPSISTGQ